VLPGRTMGDGLKQHQDIRITDPQFQVRRKCSRSQTVHEAATP
jgi:hypothetical protein